MTIDIHSLLLTYDNGTPLQTILQLISLPIWNTKSASSAYTNSSGVSIISINSGLTGIATINASSGAAYNNTSTFVFPTETSILVDSESPITTGDNFSAGNLSFTALDSFGNVNSSEQINLSITVRDVLGTTLPEIDLILLPDNSQFVY
ncbi:MAG: hypothetical protein R2741_10325 [Methanolobus sp.]